MTTDADDSRDRDDTLDPLSSRAPPPGGRPPGGLDPAPDTSLPARLGHYRVEGELGRGGMGIVYLAADTRLERQVALKVLPDRLTRDPEALARFEREAKLLAALNHPNIAIIHSLEEAEGIRFLTLERIEGDSLARRLESGPLPIGAALDVIRQVAAALQATHRKGIVHRDLKPGNVMLGPEDRVKVLDFGLASVSGPAAGGGGGSPGYMSPEQVRGEAVDARADVWAWGCLAYECLAGRAAFGGPSLAERMERTAAGEPDWSLLPAEAPPALRGLIASCLAKRAAERPGDVSDLRRAVEELLAQRSMRAAERPPPSADRPRPTNLPVPLTAFIGREKERIQALDLLRQHRLLTLAGFGGAGKTRLAVEIGRELSDAFPDGVWFVELAPIADPELVPQAVASALGVRGDPNRPVGEWLAEWLAEKVTLIVLDNCEHVLEACARLVRALLQAAPGLRILATSREGLGLGGEVLQPVPPLSLPQPSASLADLESAEAIRLFVDRARAMRPGFELTPDNAAAVADICRRLDGIALAIELAAARIKVLPPAAIAEKLDQRFRLLRSGDRTALPHHQTLRALVDWSYDQLDDADRVVLRRLSVFAGGWTVEGAEAVCSGAPVEEWEVLDRLFRLVERSLVETDAETAAETGQARYRMLETVRAYAFERLTEAAEEPQLRTRHRDWCLRLAREASPKLNGPDQGLWYARLEADHPNLRAALEWSLGGGGERGDGDAGGLSLAVELPLFWLERGYLREGIRWLGAALEREGGEEMTPARAQALHGIGNLYFRLSDLEQARIYYERAAGVREALGDRRGLSTALGNLANVTHYKGDPVKARAIFGQVLELNREFEDRVNEGITLTCIGATERDAGNLDEARQWLERAISFNREIGSVSTEAFALSNLAAVLMASDPGPARPLIERAVVLFQQIGNRYQMATGLMNLARLDRMEGIAERAIAQAARGLRILRSLGATRDLATSLEVTSDILVALGEHERALTLIGAATTIRDTLGTPRTDSAETEMERTLEALRHHLSAAAFTAGWERGRTMGWAAAVEHAVEGVPED